MSVVIQNMGWVDKSWDDDSCHYALRINSKTLTGFTHFRSKGLAECLRAAADAFEKNGEYDSIHDIPENLMSRDEKDIVYGSSIRR